MILFPAIDLKDGQCVRLLQGDMNKATVFSNDPIAQALSFASAGFKWLHVVDLDGAVEGQSVNGGVVGEIVAASKIQVQLGGGIREFSAVEKWLEAGVERVILGTAALHSPELVRRACQVFPGRICVGIDGRGGFVAVQGWVEQSSISVLDLSRRFEDAGATAIIYTDIGRDGAMKGVNIEATRSLAQKISTPVIASGGVATLEDLKKIKMLEKEGVAGVIAGRAFYEGQLDMAEAQKIIRA